ncbi:glycosyltransferase family 2 protein [Agromyces bauzanensis]
MPLISVLLPAKDAAPYVASAIESTLQAMPADAELVVIDDGSTDSTLDTIQRFSDRRLRVRQNESSKGLATSLNEAIHQTDSKYVARMDADDICLPWRFGYQLRAIEHLGLDAVFSSVLYTRPSGVVTRPDAPGHLGNRALSLSLLIGNSLVHPTFFARRNSIEEAGLFANVRAEDYELWMRMSNYGAQMARFATPTLLYRKHHAQISSSAAWRATLAEEVSRGAIADTHREFFQRMTSGALWHQDYLLAALRMNATQQSLGLLDHVRGASRELPLTVTERLYLSGRVRALRRYCATTIGA